jgi:hypothetical protein
MSALAACVDLVREHVKGTWAEKEKETPIEAVSQFIGGGLFGLLMWWATGTCGWPLMMSIPCSGGSQFPTQGCCSVVCVAKRPGSALALERRGTHRGTADDFRNWLICAAV